MGNILGRYTHKNQSQHIVLRVLISRDWQSCPLWFPAGIKNVRAHYFYIISSIMSLVLTPQLTWIPKHTEQIYIVCYLVLVKMSSDNLSLEAG